MGLFDSLSGGLKNVLEQAETAALPTLISAVLAKTSLGNMQGFLDKLQQSGLGPQVASWLVLERTCRLQLINFVQHWAMSRPNR
jgi:uncharacterized protein YidB (DUF937 family)